MKLFLLLLVCGIATASSINGGIFPQNEPHMVGLEVHREAGVIFCSGSLLSDLHVLTAAHCLEGANKVMVYLGTHNISDNTEPDQIKIEVPKKNFIIHPKFGKNSDLLVNDIAIIVLSRKVKLTEKVQPINLPRGHDVDNTFESHTATGAGYGTIHDGNDVVLQSGTLLIYSNDNCRYFVPNIEPTNLCATDVRYVAFYDEHNGGSLFIGDSRGYKEIIGVSSFVHRGPINEKWPVVYTRVAKYLSWISIHTGFN